MNIKSTEQFARDAKTAGVRLQVDPERMANLENSPPSDTLFYVPLLALAILVVGRNRSGGLHTSDMTSWTCATLAHSLTGDSSARQRFHWSFQLRRRCVDALVFLEAMNLVLIEEKTARTVKLTLQGGVFLRNCVHSELEIGRLTRSLIRSYTATEQVGLELF
jgi:hypothetical protein